jgi:HEAT repeat protein
LIRNVLITEFSVDPKMIRTITDRAATRKSLLRLINDSIPRRWDVKRSDQLFFFFAGHADVALRNRKKTWYLAPTDARVSSNGKPDWETVITGGELRRLEETFAGAHIFNVLDACYSGMQFAADVPKKRRVRVKSSYALVAGRGGEPVLDESGHGHSVFTESLTTALVGWAGLGVGDKASFKTSDLHTFIKNDVPRQIRKLGLHPIQRPFGFSLVGNVQGDEFEFQPTSPRLPPSVIQGLLNEQVTLRKAAVAQLSSLAETPHANLIIPALQRLSQDESPAVRAEVCSQLGHFPQPTSVATLERLVHDADENVAIAAARMLPKACAHERSLISDARKNLNKVRPQAERRLRRTVDFSLAQLGDPRSVRAITRDLPTEQGSIRREIIDVLRHLPPAAASDSDLTDLLQSMLRSDDWRRRRAAAEAIGELGLRGAVGTLARLAVSSTEHFMVRCAATEALGHIGQGSAVDAVRRALGTDASLLVRTAAAESLGSLGGADAVDHLATALTWDEEWRVRRAAAEACGTLRDTQALHVLQSAADDSHFRVRIAIARALGDIGSNEARSTLNTLSAQDRSLLVRQSALLALERLNA